MVPPPDFEYPVIYPGPMQLPKQPQTPSGGKQGFGVVSGPLVTGAALIPKVPSRQWKYIVIHHSDSPVGSAAIFDKAHRARGWEMLGYDFVIGNGSMTRDGLIEVGPRWTYQLTGAHAGTPDHKFNDYGIGICLVGNFDQTQPTRAQMDSLARLVAYFMKSYHIPADHVIGHRDTKPTECPGRNMYAAMPKLRQMAQNYLRSGGY